MFEIKEKTIYRSLKTDTRQFPDTCKSPLEPSNSKTSSQSNQFGNNSQSNKPPQLRISMNQDQLPDPLQPTNSENYPQSRRKRKTTQLPNSEQLDY